MNPFYIIFTLMTLFIIAGVVLSLKMLVDDQFTRKFIKLQNDAKGVKTQITPMTLRLAKISAIFFMVIACFILFMIFGLFVPQMQANPEQFIMR